MSLFVIDSDCDSYVETSDSEDQDDDENQAQSILSSLDESIGKIDDFFAYERCFLHGNIVCSISDPSGRLGRVIDVDMIVDLETKSGKLIKDVNSKVLLKIRSFVPGDYVIHGSWLGQVHRTYDAATVLFNDGSRCKVMTDNLETLTTISQSLCDDPQFPFYPGQHVRIKLPTVSKSMRWLCGSWKENHDTGIVCDVKIGVVHVFWVASVCGFISSRPPSFQDPEELTSLSCFSHATWQLGEWCTIPHEFFHSLSRVTEKLTHPKIAPQCLNEMQSLGTDARSCMHSCVIVKKKTLVNVQWQNGGWSVGLDSQSLLPVNTVGEYDFWPGQLVLEKVASEDFHDAKGPRMGFVKSVDAQERTVNVRWKVLDGEPIDNDCAEETISAYELVEHPDFSYCIGDVVLRLIPNIDSSEEKFDELGIDGQNLKEDTSHRGVFDNRLLFGKDTFKRKNISGVSVENPIGYLSCIGNVTGFKDESVEVRWASGHVSKVQPSEIFGLDKLDGLAMIVEESIPNNDTKETAAKVKTSAMLEEASVPVFPQSVLEFIRDTVTSLFGFHGFTYLSCSKGVPRPQILKTEEEMDLAKLQQENPKQQYEEEKQNEQPDYSMNNEYFIKFKPFDVADDYSDHHFVNAFQKDSISSQAKQSWLRKIHQEWNMLKKDLPDGIYVRAYEERVDLLRACIVGAAGTPYHDGLFFFDFCLPPDYPYEPPVVHYHSGGLQLNPNLYENGKVCLSLLKTWVGTGTENWNPKCSTVLQVLLSLQALVLNDKPYFNEAGYDKQIGKAEGEKNSISYNENAFLLSCKSMLYLLRNPPMHFEELVEEHFSSRWHFILMACKAYMDGAQVGCSFESSVEGNSTGFKIMVAKLFQKFMEAFTEKGIDCSQLIGKFDAKFEPCGL